MRRTVQEKREKFNDFLTIFPDFFLTFWVISFIISIDSKYDITQWRYLMAKIKFITDSASDIPDDILKKYPDIHMVPFPIHAGEDSYLDRVSMDPEDFYDLIEEEDKVTHSQITPFQFSEIFFNTWKEGYTHIIYVSINGRGSSTYQNAHQVAHSFFFDNPAAKGQIELTVIDSKSYSLAYGFAVVEGAKMAQEGKSPEEIVAFIEDWVKNSKILFVPNHLKYAKKSGRISVASAFVGEALGMKPIMTFKHGESAVLAKVRGEKNIVSAIWDMMEEDRREGAPYCVLRTTMEDHEDELIELCEEEIGYPPAMETFVGCTIAANAGVEVIGIMYRKTKKDESTNEPWKWTYEPPKAPPPGYIR